ncbi:MAG: hypothetical protein F6J93_13645 [Oscillatoria sp. SIO1A7]|nr:hypothetical protein [Oscillatoria sp. SIO1A7]
MLLESEVDRSYTVAEEAKVKREIPHTIIPRPTQLKQERIIFGASTIVPFLGLILAIALTWYSGASMVDWGLFLGMAIISILGIEVGFHRLFSHGAFQTTEPVRAILAIAGCMALQGPVTYWASNHRRHHAYSDRLGDPHSPYVKNNESLGLLAGLWHSHIGWIFDSERTCPGRYGRDILKDAMLAKIDRHYFIWVLLGLAIPAILGGLLTWTWMGIFHGLVWGGLLRIFLVQQGTYAINSFCHAIGTRPFQSRDNSCNNLWLTLPTLGGSLHNTHHAFPNTAVNALFWWQIDPGAWFIRALEFLGLAWDIKVPSAEAILLRRRKGAIAAKNTAPNKF